RDQLLRRFREAGSAILLGTDSFWEGVDVPGRALRVLILAKLPFKVPSEPLTAARLERLEARGLNGFVHYLVPNAALKLKQGFGRLIRSTTDVGAVVLLDRRVVTKRYGQLILEGLPPASRVVGRWQDVRRACEEFFAGHGIEAAMGAERRVLVERRVLLTRLSKRLSVLPSYPMAEIPALKRRLIQQGVDVIDVGAGDADLAPPRVAVEALARAARDPAMSRYAFQLGLPAFREAAAAYLQRRFGVQCDPFTELHPLLGSKEGIAHL